jgi:hypothetical protein
MVVDSGGRPMAIRLFSESASAERIRRAPRRYEGYERMRRHWVHPIIAVVGLTIVVVGLALVACVLPQPRPALVFAPARLADAQAGLPYDVRITISGNQTPVGQILVSDGQLPPGMTLTDDHENSAATIGGTPLQSGQYTFTLRAWCLGTNQSGQTGEQAYALTVR